MNTTKQAAPAPSPQSLPPDAPARALTIDAWWAWAIAHGPKRVENRTWQTHYRGPLLIHAGLTTRRDQHAIDAIGQIAPGLLRTRPEAPSKVERLRGKVIAVANLVDCLPIAEIHDPWAFGPWCWVLEDVRPLATPLAVRGLQGLWCPGGDLVRQVSNQLLSS